MPISFSHEAKLIIDPFRPPENLNPAAYADQSQRQLDIVSDSRKGQEAIDGVRSAVQNASEGATSDGLNIRFNGLIGDLDDRSQTHTQMGQTLANAATNLSNWNANLDALGVDYDAQATDLKAQAAVEPMVQQLYPLLKQALDTLTMSRAMAIGQGGSTAHMGYTGNITALNQGATNPALTAQNPLAPGMVPAMGQLDSSYMNLPGMYQPVANGSTLMSSTGNTGTIAGFIQALFNHDPLAAASEGLGVLGKAVGYLSGASQYMGQGAMDILGVSPGMGMGMGINPAQAGSLGTGGLWNPGNPMMPGGTPYDPLVQAGMYSPNGHLTGANPFAMMGSQLFNPMNSGPYGQQPGMAPGSGSQAPRGVPQFLTAGMAPQLAQAMQQGEALPQKFESMMGAALGGSYGVDNGFVPGTHSSSLAPGGMAGQDSTKPMVSAHADSGFTPSGGRGFQISGELEVSRGGGDHGGSGEHAQAQHPTSPSGGDHKPTEGGSAPSKGDTPASGDSNPHEGGTTPSKVDAPAGGDTKPAETSPSKGDAPAGGDGKPAAPAPEPAPAADGSHAGGTNPEGSTSTDKSSGKEPAAEPAPKPVSNQSVSTETTSEKPAPAPAPAPEPASQPAPAQHAAPVADKPAPAGRGVEFSSSSRIDTPLGSVSGEFNAETRLTAAETPTAPAPAPAAAPTPPPAAVPPTPVAPTQVVAGNSGAPAPAAPAASASAAPTAPAAPAAHATPAAPAPAPATHQQPTGNYAVKPSVATPTAQAPVVRGPISAPPLLGGTPTPAAQGDTGDHHAGSAGSTGDTHRDHARDVTATATTALADATGAVAVATQLAQTVPKTTGRGALVLSTILRAYRDAGYDTRAAVAVYDDGRAVYSTSDGLGVTPPGVDVDVATPLLYVLCRHAAGDEDMAETVSEFIGQWTGANDPATILALAAALGLIDNPRTIVSHYQESDGVADGVEIVGEETLRRLATMAVEPSAEVEVPMLANSDEVGMACDVMGNLWNQPVDDIAVTDFYTAARDRRWETTGGGEALWASMWWLIAQARATAETDAGRALGFALLYAPRPAVA